MAKAQGGAGEKAETAGTVEALPTSWPREQVFVAVSDNDGAAAGYDGGPEKDGIGAWARGQIGPWTTSDAVPLALRDPMNGTISRGWLEPADEIVMKNGKPTCTKSRKFFATRDPKTGTWHPAAPSPKALKRAARGAESIAEAFLAPGVKRALDSRSETLAAAGIAL